MPQISNPQLVGVEAIEGTYPFDLLMANRRLNINRFFWDMIRAETREAFHQDEEALMRLYELSEDEKQLIRARYWLGLVQHGVNFFVLEKWARVVKTTNLEVYAQMRGMSFDDFMRTRGVPESR